MKSNPKKKEKEKTRKLRILMVKEVTKNTSIEIPPPQTNFHSLRIREKEVDLSCSDISNWITITPISNLTEDLRHCPHCGQRLMSEILFDKLNALMPQPSPIN